MKKILTRKEKEKAEKKRNLIIGIIVIGLMLVSTVGYAFFSSTSSDSQKIKYNNIDFFLLEDGRWHFIINNNEFATIFNPEEVKNITTQGDFSLDDYSNLPLYLHYENNKEIEQEILYNLNKYFQRVNYFCFSNENCTWVEKNCSDGNLLIIKEASFSQIKKEEKCLYIYYNESEGLKVADSFIFKLLKIT
jgi:hypothetical protein